MYALVDFSLHIFFGCFREVKIKYGCALVCFDEVNLRWRSLLNVCTKRICFGVKFGCMGSVCKACAIVAGSYIGAVLKLQTKHGGHRMYRLPIYLDGHIFLSCFGLMDGKG
ncbi:hypothetical protein F2P56_002216 [Juglans regia]|uniref:Uncharacterized protein n=1 Tax=Juglans regia TaxID=51240 RepID=A0A833YFW8_JUGRE|nr:hypothetical protein F2P56_002216 [Juglans regia]